MPPKVNQKTTAAASPPADATPEVKKLFPTGYKYPLALLNERCQRNGWEKAIVDTYSKPGGFAFAVTLRKHVPNAPLLSVRMAPSIAYLRPTALEARHWGATYALYRFCNHIQLNRVLPPGPREYWDQLAAEHKQSPDSQKWVYDTDPFAAQQRILDEKARLAAQQEKEKANAALSPAERPVKVAREYVNAPEVRMAASLRDLAEDAIRKSMDLSSDGVATVTSLVSDTEVVRQLSNLGFRDLDIREVITFLKSGTAFALYLLRTLQPLDAALEFLMLTVPECHLPKRYQPSSSSAPFVSSAHGADDNIKVRWMVERVSKEGGWPKGFATDFVRSQPSFPDVDFALFVEALDWHLLCGDNEPADILPESPSGLAPAVDEEIEALQALYENCQIHTEWDAKICAIPLPSAPIELCVFLSERHPYPQTARLPALYVRSATVPAYVRLWLLKLLLQELSTIRQPGDPIMMESIGILETLWDRCQEDPPQMTTVMTPFLPKASAIPDADDGDLDDIVPGSKRKARKAKVDPRSNDEIIKEYKAMRNLPSYEGMHKVRSSLPAYGVRNEFVVALRNSRVVVVVGDTGSGKTTQLPQFILDDAIENNQGKEVNIVITQPRRVAALSVSDRVSAERMNDGSVGYSIRGETKATNKTKLLFCTTGIVLRRLANPEGGSLQDVTHLVIDEVHERSVESDFLLLQVKELLKHNKKLRVILMSATIDPAKFSNYFGGVPLFSIPGRTYPVQDFHLEDFVSRVSYSPENINNREMQSWNAEKKASFEKDYGSIIDSPKALKTLEVLLRRKSIDYEFIALLVEHLLSKKDEPCGVLIFLPGVEEIRSCINAINKTMGHKAVVLPLHGSLSSAEQRPVFEKVKKHKIIAATNVAETSITIDDISIVIDAGRVKETDFDPESGLVSLVEKWVSRAAANQRRGRAGRSRPGDCYRLYTRKQFGSFNAFTTPEILRMPMENVLLTTKVVQKENSQAFLSKALDPPSDMAVSKAESLLLELGAVNEIGNLTSLGAQMALIPLDVRLSKILILGVIFRCLDTMLTIAACLSSKPLMFSPPDQRDAAGKIRESFATGKSDLLTDCKAYAECVKRRSESRRVFESFCTERFVSANTVKDVHVLRAELLRSLSDIGFLPPDIESTDSRLNGNSGNQPLLKSLILAGLWPHIVRVHLPKHAIKFDQVQGGTVRRDNEAKEFHLFDVSDNNSRVFVHPSSVMFSELSEKLSFLSYFSKQMTTKSFIRNVTEAPLYAVLLFGGPIRVNHLGGGITVGGKGNEVHLKATPRIGVLVNQLRLLLDEELKGAITRSSLLPSGQQSPALQVILALLNNDGLTT